jgi:NAD(P)-dependent dehydrogenase (short-subunit alcohol dehydrogenase family)
LRLWQPQKWRAVAEALARRGMHVVWSAGPGESQVVAEIDPEGHHGTRSGPLDLAQLWHLIAGAKLLVALDSGASHLAKLAGTPTLALYGPGSVQLFGRGEFWRDAPFREITVAEFHCRDQRHLFKRQVAWVRRCNRTPDECPRALCMEAISVEDVRAAIP